ncbi:hypothetical protein K431DRAFT_7669 [Polychaeton citri CBS 116435]|uniref:Uncharacterized protein n=1 Tax=Polychaeton citri CBS 116435 TaxID=1314669 RepID=A0A9P4UPT2_9PEZI|nr:hypothetical protein K431DRAFT_7669 [Polychaeton citri CBS 116435]
MTCPHWRESSQRMMLLALVVTVGCWLRQCSADGLPRQISDRSNVQRFSDLSTSIVDLNATESLPAQVSSCLSSSASWSVANSSWFGRLDNVKTVVELRTESRKTWTKTVAIGSIISTVPTPFTTCSRVPYARGTTLLANVSMVQTITDSTYTEASPFPTPAPSCTFSLNDGQCKRWWVTHYGCTRVGLNYQYEYQPDNTCALYMSTNTAPCPEPTALGRSAGRSLVCGQCAVEARGQLHYWPVTLDGDDICSRRRVLSNTRPMTATLHGTAVTSPDVAIVYENMYAVDECGIIGTTEPAIVQIIPATAVSTIVQLTESSVFGSQEFRPLDYADLPPGAPSWRDWLANQYYCSQYLEYDGEVEWESPVQDPLCATVMVDKFAPQLAVSATTSLSKLQREWRINSCPVDVGFFDPPQPLVPVEVSGGSPAAVSAGMLTTTSLLPAQVTQLADGGISFLATTDITMFPNPIEFLQGSSSGLVIDFGNGTTSTRGIPRQMIIPAGAVIRPETATWQTPKSPRLSISYQAGTGVPRHWSGTTAVRAEVNVISYCAAVAGAFVGILAVVL